MSATVTAAAAEEGRSPNKHETALYRAKIYQMIFHWVMATLALGLSPHETLLDPIQATEDAYQHVGRIRENMVPPKSVALLYLINTTYNCILYFWDPVESTQLRLHHILSIFLGTLFAAIQNTYLFGLVLVTTYVIDSFIFVSKFRQSQRSSACLRSMIKVHHMATLMLMALSWIYNAHFYGCFVMFLHDVTDVSMFVIRLLRQHHDAHLMAKQMLVVPILLLTWTYYRVYLFGSLIANCLHQLTWPAEATAQHLVDYRADTLVWSCVAGMFILWTFNVYWTFLVAKKAWLTLVNRPGSEHDDNE